MNDLVFLIASCLDGGVLDVLCFYLATCFDFIISLADAIVYIACLALHMLWLLFLVYYILMFLLTSHFWASSLR